MRFGHDQAFLAGLIHDLGKLVMAVLSTLELIENFAPYRTGHETAAGKAARLHSASPSHGAVGAALAKHWHFPDSLSQAIGNHHPPFEGSDRITDIVHVADALAITYCAARTGKALNVDSNTLDIAAAST